MPRLWGMPEKPDAQPEAQGARNAWWALLILLALMALSISATLEGNCMGWFVR